MKADQVEPLSELLEMGKKEKSDLEDEIKQLKESVEKVKLSFQQELSKFQEDHQLEMETQSIRSQYSLSVLRGS